jgi:hypothetical protein
MMRSRTLVVVVLAMLLTGCGVQSDRPEGIVERWLLSLNQGAAGRPDRYAPSQVSERVLPGWRDLEPGALDRIVIGTDRGSPTSAIVPFLVADLRGQVTEGVAVVERADGDVWRITDIEAGASGLSVEGSAWAVAGAPRSAWPVAGGVAVLLAVLAVLLVRVVRRPEREPA